MKVTRLFCVVLSFLLLVSFFRVVNGASFIGASEILNRFDRFEFDLSPVTKLVDTWDSVSDKSLGGRESVGALSGDRVSGGSFGAGGFYSPDDTELSVLQRFYEYIKTLSSSVTQKIQYIGVTLEYLWNDGISLISIPIQVFIQTWDFTLWLLGFTQ